MLSNQKNPSGDYNPDKATLLVVEDNNDIWLIISLLLSKQLPGVPIHRVVNAEQALTYLDEALTGQQRFPQLILQNLYLPMLQDGLTLIEAVRDTLKTNSAPQIPILIMSSSGNRDDIRRAYCSGASSYYLKPTDVGQWISYFEHLCQYWLESVRLPVL